MLLCGLHNGSGRAGLGRTRRQAVAKAGHGSNKKHRGLLTIAPPRPGAAAGRQRGGSHAVRPPAPARVGHTAKRGGARLRCGAA